MNRHRSSEPARHAKRSWKKRSPQISFSKSVLYLSLVFFFAPLLVTAFYSFNNSKNSTFSGLSLVWYQQLFFSSMPLWKSLLTSMIIAITSSLAATVLGTLAALGVTWYKFFGRAYIQTISFLPMVLPEVIMAISLSIFFTSIHISQGMLTIFIAHTTFCLPFVYLMVSARIDEFDYSIIEASHDLGANEAQTLTKVIIPSIMPGIISGFMMSVTISLEDYVITSLVNGGGNTTLPIYIYSLIKVGVSPVINALSFLLILVVIALTFVFRKSLKTFASSH